MRPEQYSSVNSTFPSFMRFANCKISILFFSVSCNRVLTLINAFVLIIRLKPHFHIFLVCFSTIKDRPFCCMYSLNIYDRLSYTTFDMSLLTSLTLYLSSSDIEQIALNDSWQSCDTYMSYSSSLCIATTSPSTW